MMVVLALLGLGIVQFEWVKAGIVVEKQAFDREFRALLEAAALSVAQEPDVAKGILALQQLRRKGQPAPDSLRAGVRFELEEQLREYLEAEQKNLPFSVALTESIWRYPLIVGDRFDWAESAAYRTYSHPIEGTMIEACGCQLFLHLQLRDFLPHLLVRLWVLLALTGLGLSLLLTGFIMLVRKVRRERRLVAVKNDFINTLTHELKTPVFSSSLLLRLLREAIISGHAEKGMDYLDKLVQENEHLKVQIEQVLELASLEQPLYQLEREPLNLQHWLEEVSTSFLAKVEAAGGQLGYKYNAPPGILEVDAGHLTNALNNLLDNALKYSNEPPVITVTLGLKGQNVVLEVQDNGPGIPEDKQDEVFQKFSRLHQGHVQGFGLGLSYVKQIARLHEGEAGVRNHIKGGAVFWIQIPGFKPEEADVASKKQIHG